MTRRDFFLHVFGGLEIATISRRPRTAVLEIRVSGVMDPRSRMLVDELYEHLSLRLNKRPENRQLDQSGGS